MNPADLPLTTTPALVVVAVVSLLVVGALAWGVRRGRRGRRVVVLAVVTVLLVALNVAGAVNAHYDYDRTLGAALGLEPDDEVALAELMRRTTVPDQGVLTPVTIPPTASGFVARQTLVYVPPAWFARPRPPLPVVVLLHGTPGTPQDWTDAGQADDTANRFAAAHAGRAPILVMPDVNGATDADTECVDSPLGRVETYLTADVVSFVGSTFATRPPGRDWAVAGLSEGGSCALMLALRHPTLFATFGDYSGLAGPRVGETNADTGPTVAGLFGGSPAAFAAHEPADILARTRLPELGGWFEVGDADPEPAAAQAALVPEARRARVTTCAVVVPGGGHTFDVFAAAFADSLPWMAGRLGLAPPVRDPRCAD